MDGFLIGDILLHWYCDGYSLAPGNYMDRFRYNGEWAGERIDLCGRVELLEPYTAYTCMERNRVYDRYDVDGEPLLVYHWGYLRYGFGIWPKRVGKQADMCIFDPALKTQPPVRSDWFFGVCGMHAEYLRREAPILHASYVEFEGKAILFTAPSQTGKSTQAALWQAHAGAKIINGDRVLLKKRDGVWHAFGFPCCGSSDICVDRTLPIAAIIVLEQGKVNTISQLPQSQKIRALVSGTEVHLWDMEQIDQAIKLAGQIAEQVPIVKLSCTPDENAVAILRQYLEDENYV